MIKIIPLARCQYGAAKDQETDAATWERELADFPERVRRHAANMAAHSHDITIVGDAVLISCSWYNSSRHNHGTGYFYKDTSWRAIHPDDYDKLYPRIRPNQGERGSAESGVYRTNTIKTEFLA
jgi:hypothetical protein